MRIVGGKLKGRRINPPKNLPVRPTTDMAKESLFNILNNKVFFEDVKVLDVFAGTGNISMEFISRGVISVDSVDQNRACISYIDKTSKSLKIENLRAIQSDYKSFFKYTSEQWDVIFADPPYAMKEAFDTLPSIIFEKGLLKKDGIFILEHSEKYSFKDHPNFSEQRKYGRVHFSFFLAE